MVLFAPAIDTSPTDMGFGHKLLGKQWRDLSPRHHIDADTPPTLIFHGTADKVIPVAGIHAFHQDMKAIGLSCETRIYEKAGHKVSTARGKLPDGRNPFITFMTEMDAWLVGKGYLDGTPTADSK